MKPLLTAIALISLAAGNGACQSNRTAGGKHYPIKSCRIVFRFFNGPQNGTKTIIFDDWGNKEKEEVETMTDTAAMRKGLASAPPAARQIEFPAVQHNLKITLEGQSYSMDLDHHIGAKSSANFLFGGSAEDNLKQMGFALIRTDTLLGKSCKVWERPGLFRLWIWNNYTVKKEMVQNLPAGMRVEEYATEIDENYSIKPDEFKIPDNIQFR